MLNPTLNNTIARLEGIKVLNNEYLLTYLQSFNATQILDLQAILNNALAALEAEVTYNKGITAELMTKAENDDERAYSYRKHVIFYVHEKLAVQRVIKEVIKALFLVNQYAA